MANRPICARLGHAAAIALVAIALALVSLVAYAPMAARADMPTTGSSPVIDDIPSEFQARVEETAAAYNEAVARREEIELQIAECEARLAELEAQLPGAQERAADAIYTQYRYGQNSNGLLELILSAEDYNQFLATLTYLDSVTTHTANALEELVALTEAVELERAALDTVLAAAQEQELVAEAAMQEAIAAREEAARRAAEEAARRAAEAAARAQAEAAARAEAEQGDGSGAENDGAVEGESGGEAAGGAVETAPSEPEPEPAPEVTWTERDAFIAEWGPRIDAFYATYCYGNSPLQGYGSVFAAAAWDYGVDPRFSPAISFVESTGGQFCFRWHNAWGWGQVDWPDWPTAIYAHVAGLSRGYGYTVTYEGALKYCPPNADYWYWKVSEMMSYI